MSTGPASSLQSIADEIRALTPANQLRLAADLIEKQQFDLAHTIASVVVNELGLVATIVRPR